VCLMRGHGIIDRRVIPIFRVSARMLLSGFEMAMPPVTSDEATKAAAKLGQQINPCLYCGARGFTILTVNGKHMRRCQACHRVIEPYRV
jgi:hypothetical protein